MSKRKAPQRSANPARVAADQERRRSGAAGAHDTRPNRQRTRAAAAASRSRAPCSRDLADSIVSASWRYLRAKSTFSQRRNSSRNR